MKAIKLSNLRNITGRRTARKRSARIAAAIFLSAIACARAGITGPVTVGTKGNEPIVAVAPDGTLYISALQHIYRSVNGGVAWTELPGPIFASQLNLNSDSSISVDPGNRLYFSFDYPYAGTTAVCTSDDKGDSWSCNPAVVPGGTDRMWVLAPTIKTAFEVTNQGLYETTFLTSTDRGATFVPRAVGSGVFEPQTGPLLKSTCGSNVLQSVKIYGNGPADEGVKFYVYTPFTTGAVLSDIRSTGLKLPTALPGAGFTRDGVLYVSSEESNAAGGRQVVVARSPDEGLHWTKLPPLPATTAGTATFSWIATGDPGHVGVLYYYTADNGDPGTLSNSSWKPVWAESSNADTSTPTWTFTEVDGVIHKGGICVAADCMGANRFSGDFINATFDQIGAAHLTWVQQDLSTGKTSIRYARVQSGPASTYIAPPCGPTPSPTATPTPSPSPTPSATPSPTATPTPSPSPTPSATPSPTATPTPSPSPMPSATPSPTATPTPSPSPSPASVQLRNISGRVVAQTGDKVGIAGFIIRGPGFKRVIVRAMGPSLKFNGQLIAGTLQDPMLEIHDSTGGVISNDNWRSTQEADIQQTGLAPEDDREAAIVTRLREGSYTAIISGAKSTTGIGVVEVYDLDSTASGTQLGNLSVRANVQTDDNVLIDGVIIGTGAPKQVVFRAIGPSLSGSGVSGALMDPILELHDGNGSILATNDNWKDAPNATEIQASGLAPRDEHESAVLIGLGPGNYTSIVRGVNRTTGIGIAEAFKLDQ